MNISEPQLIELCHASEDVGKYVERLTNLVAAHGDNPWMRDAITRVQEQLHAARMHKLSLIRELHR